MNQSPLSSATPSTPSPAMPSYMPTSALQGVQPATGAVSSTSATSPSSPTPISPAGFSAAQTLHVPNSSVMNAAPAPASASHAQVPSAGAQQPLVGSSNASKVPHETSKSSRSASSRKRLLALLGIVLGVVVIGLAILYVLGGSEPEPIPTPTTRQQPSSAPAQFVPGAGTQDRGSVEQPQAQLENTQPQTALPQGSPDAQVQPVAPGPENAFQEVKEVPGQLVIPGQVESDPFINAPAAPVNSQ